MRLRSWRTKNRACTWPLARHGRGPQQQKCSASVHESAPGTKPPLSHAHPPIHLSVPSPIYMSQYFAKSPQHASEKIKPVRMLMLGLLLVCSMTAALLASASHGELPPHLHVSVSAESSSRLSAKIKPSVILILGGCLHSPL